MTKGVGREATRAQTVPETSNRLRNHLARRGRQVLRVITALAFVLACGVVGVLVWRPVSLIGLPDVGDPFDLASVEPVGIPADQDAFALFRRARDMLPPMPELPRSARQSWAIEDWSKAAPELRGWVESSRPAMELFRRAAAQADGIAHSWKSDSLFSYHQIHLGPLWLVLLEGSRLEERGEIAEAWSWYRALLEMRAHIMRRGTALERYFAEQNSRWLRDRIAAWAANPKTERADLRRALDDVMRTRPRPEWEITSMREDYRLAMRELDRPDSLLASGWDDDLAYRIGGESLPPNLARTIYGAWRFVRNEPERSRRVLRLIFANWLSHLDDEDPSHRSPVIRMAYRDGQRTILPVYAFGPTAPARARTFAPEKLPPWFFTAHDAKRLLFQWPWPSIGLQQRQHHRELMVLLAEELHRRDHGGPPASEAALVGTYVESLPDDGTAELDIGSIPVIEDTSKPPRSPSGP